MGATWQEAVYRFHDSLDAEAPLPHRSAAPNARPIGGEVILLDGLTIGAVSIAAIGLVAEIVQPPPPSVSWAAVILAAIPAVTLGMRLAYWAYLRHLDHEERMEALRRGQTPKSP